LGVCPTSQSLPDYLLFYQSVTTRLLIVERKSEQLYLTDRQTNTSTFNKKKLAMIEEICLKIKYPWRSNYLYMYKAMVDYWVFVLPVSDYQTTYCSTSQWLPDYLLFYLSVTTRLLIVLPVSDYQTTYCSTCQSLPDYLLFYLSVTTRLLIVLPVSDYQTTYCSTSQSLPDYLLFHQSVTTRLLIVLPVCHYQTTYCWKTKPKQLKWTDRRTPWPSNKKTGVDRRSNDEGQVMTIPHITLWFRWAKKDADIGKILLQIFRFAFYSTTQSCKKKHKNNMVL
jgi:hypothetical protein